MRKIEGKIEENEENRGLNDKKAYEDYFTTLFSFRLEIFSILLLSYSFSLRSFLENYWSTLEYIGFGERRQRKSRKCKGKGVSIATT